mgnify:CR=1 FL=1
MGFFGSRVKTINQFATSPLYSPGMMKGVMADQMILSKHSGASSRESFNENIKSLRDGFNMHQLNNLLGSSNTTSLYAMTLDTSEVLNYIQTNIDSSATAADKGGDTTYESIQNLYIRNKDPLFNLGDSTFTISGKTYEIDEGYPGVMKYKELHSDVFFDLISYNGSTIVVDGKVWNVDNYTENGDVYTFSVSYSTLDVNGEGTVGNGTVILTITASKVIDLQGAVTSNGSISKTVNLTETEYIEVCTTSVPPVCSIEVQPPVVTSYSTDISYDFKIEESYMIDAIQIMDKYLPVVESTSWGRGYLHKGTYTPDTDPEVGGIPIDTYYDLGPVIVSGAFGPVLYVLHSLTRSGSDTSAILSRGLTDSESGGEAYGETLETFLLPPVDLIDYQLYALYSGTDILVEYTTAGGSKLAIIPSLDTFYTKTSLGITPFVPLKEKYELVGSENKATLVALRSLGIGITKDTDEVDEGTVYSELSDSKIRDAYLLMNLDLTIFVGYSDEAIAARGAKGMGEVVFNTLKAYSISNNTVEDPDYPTRFKLSIQKTPDAVTVYGDFTGQAGEYTLDYQGVIEYDAGDGQVSSGDYVIASYIVSSSEKKVVTVRAGGDTNVSSSLLLGTMAQKNLLVLNGAAVWLEKSTLPIPIDVITKLGYQEKINVYDYCLQIGMRVLYTIKLKWYQTSFFRAVIFYVTGYLALVTGGFWGFVLWGAGQAGFIGSEVQLIYVLLTMDWGALIDLATGIAQVSMYNAAILLQVVNSISAVYYERQLSGLSSDYESKQKQLESKVEDLEEETKNNKDWNLLARYDVFEDPKYDPFAYMDRFWDIAYGRITHNYDQYYTVPGKLTLQ